MNELGAVAFALGLTSLTGYLFLRDRIVRLERTVLTHGSELATLRKALAPELEKRARRDAELLEAYSHPTQEDLDAGTVAPELVGIRGLEAVLQAAEPRCGAVDRQTGWRCELKPGHLLRQAVHHRCGNREWSGLP